MGHHPKLVGPSEMKVYATPQARSLAEVLGEDKVNAEYVVEEGHDNDRFNYMTSCGICRVMCFPSLLLCEYVCVYMYWLKKFPLLSFSYKYKMDSNYFYISVFKL